MTATLRWIPPTKNVDGSKITGKITYDLYQFRKHGIHDTIDPVQTGLTKPTAKVTTRLTPNTNQCFAVRAYVNGVASMISNIACIHIPGV